MPSNYYKSNESLTYLVMFIESFFFKDTDSQILIVGEVKIVSGFLIYLFCLKYFFFGLSPRNICYDENKGCQNEHVNCKNTFE